MPAAKNIGTKVSMVIRIQKQVVYKNWTITIAIPMKLKIPEMQLTQLNQSNPRVYKKTYK
jgi:hypothetical protein